MDELEEEIKFSIELFGFKEMYENSLSFLNILGFESQRTIEVNSLLPIDFLKQFEQNIIFDKKSAHFKSWKEIRLIFQYSSSEMQKNLVSFPLDQSNNNIQSLLFFFVKLKDLPFGKTFLKEISFEINKLFHIPCFIIFQYMDFIAISVTERRPNKINRDKDVIEGVYIVKDINIFKVQDENLMFLSEISLNKIIEKNTLTNFDMLMNIWRDLFNQVVHKKIINKDHLLEKAIMCYERNAYQYAIAICNDILEIDPLMIYALEIRAFSLYYLDDLDDALEDCEFALSIDPNNVKMSYLLSLFENSEFIYSEII